MKTNTLNQFPAVTDIRISIPNLYGWIRGLLHTIITWNERHKSRRSMAATDLKTLQEFGLNPADVFIESNKSFWEN